MMISYLLIFYPQSVTQYYITYLLYLIRLGFVVFRLNVDYLGNAFSRKNVVGALDPFIKAENR